MRSVVCSALLALGLGSPSPAAAQEAEEELPAPVAYRVAEVDVDTRMLRLVPADALPEGLPLEGELLLEWTEYGGRMQTEEGFPVTLETVRVGAMVNVWLDGTGDVVWMVFTQP